MIATRLTASAFAICFGIASFAAAGPVLRGHTDKDQYAPGEPILFTFTVQGEDAPAEGIRMTWRRAGDDGQTESGEAMIKADAPVEVKTRMDKPGFVQIHAKLAGPGVKSGDRGARWIAAAGVAIEEIRGVDEPADFDAFWAAQKRRLAAVPLEPVVSEAITNGAPNVKMFKVSIPCAGPRPATGYLVVPADAKPGSCAAHVTFNGYGMGGQEAPRWFDAREITFAINAHGFELGRDEEYYKQFSKEIGAGGVGGGYAFNPAQNQDPETTYFNGMILRDLRALEHVKTLPEWNGRALKVSGGSQGGFQALLMAALDPAVTRCEAAAPWLCDMGGKARLGRHGGWQPAFTDALNYYDPVHHAKRIPQTCFVDITRAGLGDDTCPPSGVAAVYNALRAPGNIRFVQGSEHQDWGQAPAGTQIFTLARPAK